MSENIEKNTEKHRNFENVQNTKKLDFFFGEGKPDANSAYAVRGAAAPRPRPVQDENEAFGRWAPLAPIDQTH